MYKKGKYREKKNHKSTEHNKKKSVLTNSKNAGPTVVLKMTNHFLERDNMLSGPQLWANFLCSFDEFLTYELIGTSFLRPLAEELHQ